MYVKYQRLPQSRKKRGEGMADNKEIKPKSFRIDDETANKFKEISNSIGGNQQETLAKLIEAWEFQSGKTVLKEKKADIEQFEKYVTALTRMFMGSLEDNQNITETIRTEFEAQLKSKDITIQDLQEKLETAKQSEKETKISFNTCFEENKHLNEYIESLRKEYNSKLDDMQSMLADKEKANQTLTDHSQSLKTQLQECEAIKIQLKELECLKTENTSLKDRLERKDFEFEKSMLEFERKKQNEILELKNEHIKEIEYYQSQYKELLKEKESITTSTNTRRKKTVEKPDTK